MDSGDRGHRVKSSLDHRPVPVHPSRLAAHRAHLEGTPSQNKNTPVLSSALRWPAAGSAGNAGRPTSQVSSRSPAHLRGQSSLPRWPQVQKSGRHGGPSHPISHVRPPLQTSSWQRLTVSIARRQLVVRGSFGQEHPLSDVQSIIVAAGPARGTQVPPVVT